MATVTEPRYEYEYTVSHDKGQSCLRGVRVRVMATDTEPRYEYKS